MSEIQTPPRGFGARVLHEAGGELATAATYLLAWLFSAWLSDAVLLALVVAVVLQFWIVTPLIGVITPRGARGIFWCVLAHGALFFLLWLIASAGGRDDPDWWAVALAQAPLLLRNLSRLWRPAHLPTIAWLEALGPVFLVLPVGLVTMALAAVLPDLGLAGRVMEFEQVAPVTSKELKFALMGGFAYFSMYAVARTAWQDLGGDEHRRADLDPATIRRWRDDYLRSRGGK